MDKKDFREVLCCEMAEQIAKDFGIEYERRCIRKFESYPLGSDGNRKINAFIDSVIVDRDGNEHPYMLDCNRRNDSRLKDFDHIYNIYHLSLEAVVAISDVELESEECKISEGGGWYSRGMRYYYKDMYCEL